MVLEESKVFYIVLINTIVTKAGSKSISDILNPEEEEAEE